MPEKRGNITTWTSFVISLASFAISVTVAGYNFWGYHQGADIAAFTPEKVYFVAWDYGGSISTTGTKQDRKIGGSMVFLRLAATIGYANTGQSGYNAVVKRESVTMELPDGKEYILHWSEFTKFRESPAAAFSTDPASQGSNGLRGLWIDSMEGAHPRVIVAGNTEAHQTFFAATQTYCPKDQSWECSNRNFLAVDENLVKRLEKFQEGEGLIKLKFTFELYNRASIKKTCNVRVNQITPQDLLTWRWTDAVCVEG